MVMVERRPLWSAMTVLALAGLGCEPALPEGGEVIYESQPFTDLNAISAQGTGGVLPTGGVVSTGGSVALTGGILASAGVLLPGDGVVASGSVAASGGGFVTGGLLSSGGLALTGGALGTGGQDMGRTVLSGGAVSTSEVSSMTFEVTTGTQGGRYSPKNIGVIWIEDAQGNWVRTLEKWAVRRARYLRKYAGAGADAFIDVVATATLRRHATHSVTWDLNSGAGARVTDGDFTVWVEVTEKDGQGDYISVPFSLSAGSGVTQISDEASFSGMSVELN